MQKQLEEFVSTWIPKSEDIEKWLRIVPLVELEQIRFQVLMQLHAHHGIPVGVLKSCFRLFARMKILDGLED